jgi:hypothetical protein
MNSTGFGGTAQVQNASVLLPHAVTAVVSDLAGLLMRRARVTALPPTAADGPPVVGPGGVYETRPIPPYTVTLARAPTMDGVLGTLTYARTLVRSDVLAAWGGLELGRCDAAIAELNRLAVADTLPRVREVYSMMQDSWGLDTSGAVLSMPGPAPPPPANPAAGGAGAGDTEPRELTTGGPGSLTLRFPASDWPVVLQLYGGDDAVMGRDRERIYASLHNAQLLLSAVQQVSACLGR